MTTETPYQKAKRKVREGMQISNRKSDQNYWLAYITGLLDFSVITQDQYINIRDAEILIKKEG